MPNIGEGAGSDARIAGSTQSKAEVPVSEECMGITFGVPGVNMTRTYVRSFPTCRLQR